MKSIFITLLITITLILSVDSQNKYDYNWLLGYESSIGNVPDSFFGGVQLDFNTYPINPQYFYTPTMLGQASIFSSPNGELQCYTEGCNIYDSNHNIVPGGDSINYTQSGVFWRKNCDDIFAYPGIQGTLILPWPSDSTRAIVFHFRFKDEANGLELLYSTIKFSQTGPLVVSKNEYITSTTLTGYLSAVRHGNGRDWWVVFPLPESNTFSIILFDPTGISDIKNQSIGYELSKYFSSGQSVFSPSGDKYARYVPRHGLDLYDFDRCSGEFFNHTRILNAANSQHLGGGTAFSSNNRFLYVANNKHLYQYDLLANNILSSNIKIGTYDGFIDPFPTDFNDLLLAPNDKIYMSSSNAVKSLHVINFPNRKGHLCSFEQHSINLPAYIAPSLPNQPFYRLGPLLDSNCDTLNINHKPVSNFIYYSDPIHKSLIHFVNLSYNHPESFNWSFDDGNISSSKDPSNLYLHPGMYNVCLRSINEFGSNTHCLKLNLPDSSFLNVSLDFDIEIYPNPLKDQIMIDFATFNPGETAFELFDVTGKCITKGRIPQYMETFHIDASMFPVGTYIIKILYRNSLLVSKKLIKLN